MGTATKTTTFGICNLFWARMKLASFSTKQQKMLVFGELGGN
jgi:hypothetical protein